MTSRSLQEHKTPVNSPNKKCILTSVYLDSQRPLVAMCLPAVQAVNHHTVSIVSGTTHISDLHMALIIETAQPCQINILDTPTNMAAPTTYSLFQSVAVGLGMRRPKLVVAAGH